MSNKNGQIASLDLIFALTIFMILVITSFIIWETYTKRLTETTTFQELELTTIQIADLLTKTPGVPDNWEKNITEDNIQALGLAEDDRVISQAKLTALTQLGYNKTGILLNIDRYRYYISLTSNNQKIIEIGNLTRTKAVKIEREVIYQNAPAKFEIATQE